MSPPLGNFGLIITCLALPQLFFAPDGSSFLAAREIKQNQHFLGQQSQQAVEKLARLEAQLRAMGINLEES